METTPAFAENFLQIAPPRNYLNHHLGMKISTLQTYLFCVRGLQQQLQSM